MKAIIRKELADHFGSARFLMILALIFMAALIVTSLAGESVKALLNQGAGNFLAGRGFLLIFTAPAGFFSLVSFLGFFGPMIGLILGFDAINRERNQGTLSKLLSQPIYRDEVILGKYLAGLITIVIMVSALILLSAALGLIRVGLVPGAAELLRLFIFWLASVLYLGFWLGLAIFFSIVCRAVATSALACAALWIFLAFFVTVAANFAAGVFAPVDGPQNREELLANERFYRAALLASPTNLYAEAGDILLDPGKRGTDQSLRLAAMSRPDRELSSRFQSLLPVGQSIILVAPHLLLLLGFSLLTFYGSYLAFARQEIRSV